MLLYRLICENTNTHKPKGTKQKKNGHTISTFDNYIQRDRQTTRETESGRESYFYCYGERVMSGNKTGEHKMRI